MAKIQFESIESRFSILNPSKNFAEDMHTVLVRKDPLLGDTSVYNPFLKDKVRLFFGECDPEVINRLVEDSRPSCFLCGENIAKSTPMYPSVIVPDGRILAGESTLFPNLFSIAQYHAVVSLSKNHFLKLQEFSPELLSDGLSVAQKFLIAVYRHDPAAAFTVACANYLFPAGASLVHPHIQALITPVAYSYHGRLVEACRKYYLEKGSAYHGDLVEEEKAIGLRYIGRKGSWHWLTAFSPMGNNEVMAIHEDEGDFESLTEDDIRDLGYGLSKVLAFYGSIGHLSFNFALFSTKKSSREKGIRCLLKVMNRQNLYQNYRNDDYFLQKLLQSELIIMPPEELASQIRSSFGADE